MFWGFDDFISNGVAAMAPFYTAESGNEKCVTRKEVCWCRDDGLGHGRDS